MNFKATILACMTFLAGIAIIIMYASQQDRYAIFSQDKAIFVFDRKNATLNFCNEHACQLITPYAGENGAMINGQLITPAMMQQSGMMQMGQVAQPFMPQMTPQTSLQAPVSPMMQPQQVVLMTPQQQASKAPAPAGVAPAASAPAAAPAAESTAPAADPASPAEAPAEAAPAEAPAEEAPAE